MAGEQDKSEPSRHYDWQSIHLAYRTPDAIYLYVQQNQAYLLNTELDAAWTFPAGPAFAGAAAGFQVMPRAASIPHR